MVTYEALFLTEIQFSWEIFRNPYLNLTALNFKWVRHTIHKRMDKQKSQTDAFNSIYEPLYILNHINGLNTFLDTPFCTNYNFTFYKVSKKQIPKKE